jgi:hypothetical protein
MMVRNVKNCKQGAGIGTGHIKFRKDGIYILDGDGSATRIAAPILVAAFSTCNPHTPRESAFTVIEFVDRRDK